MALNVRKQMVAMVAPPTGSDDLTLEVYYDKPLRNGSAINGALKGVGGVPPYGGYALTGAPGWLSVNASTGIFSGVANAVGTTQVQAQVTDSASVTYTCTVTINVQSRMYPVAVSPYTGEVGAPYLYHFAVGGNLNPVRWTSSGTLPSNFALTAEDYATFNSTTLTGVPTIVGTTLHVPITSGVGFVDGEWISMIHLFNSLVGQIVSGGGTTTAVIDLNTAIVTGSPTGYVAGNPFDAYNSLNNTGGMLGDPSGSVTATPGGYYFTIRATDTVNGDFLDIPVHIEIVDQPVATFDNTYTDGGTFAPDLHLGVPYKETVTVVGGVPPFRFVAAGLTSDIGLSVDSATGTVSGTLTDPALADGSILGGPPYLIEVGGTDALGADIVVAQAGLYVTNISRDTTMAAGSDSLYTSQSAVIAYVAAHGGGGSGIIPYGVASGTNTYAATMTPVVSSYSLGQGYNVRFTNTNTGASTLDLGPGALTLKQNGIALAANSIIGGGILQVVYDGTDLQIVSPGGINLALIDRKLLVFGALE